MNHQHERHYLPCFAQSGVHPVWDHVCEWQEGSSHGQEPLLRRREFLHHPIRGGKKDPQPASIGGPYFNEM